MRLCQLFKPSPPSTHFFLNKNTRGAVINSAPTVELELSKNIQTSSLRTNESAGTSAWIFDVSSKSQNNY